MHLYCLQQDHSEYFKIGITVRDIDKRLRQYFTHSPHETKLVASREFPCQESLAYAEGWVHRQLAQFRHPKRKEWFRAPLAKIRALIAKAPLSRG